MGPNMVFENRHVTPSTQMFNNINSNLSTLISILMFLTWQFLINNMYYTLSIDRSPSGYIAYKLSTQLYLCKHWPEDD